MKFRTTVNKVTIFNTHSCINSLHILHMLAHFQIIMSHSVTLGRQDSPDIIKHNSFKNSSELSYLVAKVFRKSLWKH